jgi:hypothetical protein
MTRYTFTFIQVRHPLTDQRLRRRRDVYVTAQGSREAWAIFQALYPFKFFTCYGVSTK